MIETIKAGVELTCIVINYSLYISYKIGHFLVNTISLLQKVLSQFIYLLFEVAGAIFESFTTFHEDVTENFQHILRTISSVDVITHLSDFRNIAHSIVLVIKTLSDLVLKVVGSVVSAMHTALLSPKYLAFYLTKTFWFILASIKDTFYDIGAFFLANMHSLLQKSRDFIIAGILFWTDLPQTIYNLLTEVPVESVLSIMLSCCLIYIFARFYVIIIAFLYRQLKKFVRIIRRKYNELERYFTSSYPHRVVYRRPVLPTRRPHIRTGRNSMNASKNEENDRYCVICQEHIKCVLLLPCKHLCMCNECVNTLQMYNDNCPICRTHIETTMQIFV